MRIINGKIDFTSNNEVWLQLNPYNTIGTVPKEFTASDLFIGEVLKTVDNYIEVIEFGGACYFGKDNFSYMWVKFKEVNETIKNPNKYYISINTHNPLEVYHKTPENPEGSKYGGLSFGGWCDTVEECIKTHFPVEYTKEGSDTMYYSKTLKVTSIKQTDLETGEVINIEINDNYNYLLNTLK